METICQKILEEKHVRVLTHDLRWKENVFEMHICMELRVLSQDEKSGWEALF